jgi:hypothetical protein
MPALPVVPQVLRISLKHTYGNDTDVISHLYFEYSGTAPTVAELNTFASSVSSSWNATLRTHATAACVLVGVDVIDLTSATSAVGIWTGSLAGTNGESDFPHGTAVLVNYAIARRYRGGKPRSYFPYGGYTDAANGNNWSTSFITAFTTSLTTFIADIVALTWTGATISEQVSVSLYEGFVSSQNPLTNRWRNIPTPRATALIDPIVSWAVNPKYGSQRRRNLH